MNELFHQLANNNDDCGSDKGFQGSFPLTQTVLLTKQVMRYTYSAKRQDDDLMTIKTIENTTMMITRTPQLALLQKEVLYEEDKSKNYCSAALQRLGQTLGSIQESYHRTNREEDEQD